MWISLHDKNFAEVPVQRSSSGRGSVVICFAVDLALSAGKLDDRQKSASAPRTIGAGTLNTGQFGRQKVSVIPFGGDKLWITRKIGAVNTSANYK